MTSDKTRIAIVGASRDRSKFGNKAVRAFMERGDIVFPIHPAQEEVEGLKAYASLCDVPGEVDIASFYVSPSIGLKVLEECARKGVHHVLLNPGAESEAILKRARELEIEVQNVCSIRLIGRTPSEFED